ncbi:hypothetical protein DM02DRAFT_655825 [Periconia macrospinosa]|uniref:Uncharacterized protein n=1 Tax=Periconia macrospinosa TaxID=97972 RepID=A0A2V1DS72_9PLEO|nr:hypothetical protein DM02DRAFT_655825 [Periconia macrospinosa]
MRLPRAWATTRRKSITTPGSWRYGHRGKVQVRTVDEILLRFASAVTTLLSSSVRSVPVVVAKRAVKADLTSFRHRQRESRYPLPSRRLESSVRLFFSAIQLSDENPGTDGHAQDEGEAGIGHDGGTECIAGLYGDSTGDGTGGCGGGGAIVGTIDGAGGAGSSGNAGDDVSNGDGPGDDIDGVASDDVADNIGDGAGDAAADDAGEVQDKVANEGRGTDPENALYMGATAGECVDAKPLPMVGRGSWAAMRRWHSLRRSSCHLDSSPSTRSAGSSRGRPWRNTSIWNGGQMSSTRMELVVKVMRSK